MDATKIGVFAIFMVMIAAVGLQISVFLDPQNNLATGEVTSLGGTILNGSPVILALGGIMMLTIFYSAYRVLRN